MFRCDPGSRRGLGREQRLPPVQFRVAFRERRDKHTSNGEPVDQRLRFADNAMLDVELRNEQPIYLLRPLIEFASRAFAVGTSPHVVLTQLERQFPAQFQMFEHETAGGMPAMRLREEIAFPSPSPVVSFVYQNPVAHSGFGFDTDERESIEMMHEILWRLGSGNASPRSLEEIPLWPDISSELFRHEIVSQDACSPRYATRLAQPGIHRLQHASLLFRTQTTGVVVDPHLHSTYRPRELTTDFARRDLEGLVDGILISHSHADHYNPSTLLLFPRDTPIVVPRVPRGSILCPDMAAELRRLGFARVITPEWYGAPLQIGDVTIWALPFYGEQPLRNEPLYSPYMRNWGNSYLVRANGTFTWVVIDAGADYLGDMCEVAERIRSDFGNIDCIASNLRRFEPFTPFYITDHGHYWLSLSLDQMYRFREFRHDMLTLGPGGVARICRIAEAEHFLPYAHWWNEVGQLGGDSESTLIEELQRHLFEERAKAKVYPWPIGGRFSG